MYRSEQMFSKALIRTLKKHLKIVQRIESGETGRGIPDIYCRGWQHEIWIEVKNDPRQSIYRYTHDIKWRAGQQAWHLDYFYVCNHEVLTIQAMKDGFVIVPLRDHYRNNQVPSNVCYSCTELSDIWPIIKMVKSTWK